MTSQLKLKPEKIHYGKNYAFQAIDNNTIELKIGQACIRLRTDGCITLANPNAQLTLNPNGKIEVSSGDNVHVDAKRNVYLNDSRA